MADPPSGGALGGLGPGRRGGRGEGPRRGRGRRISPPDPAAAPELQARLRVAASRDSPRRGPRAPGLTEVSVSAHGAPWGPAPASGSRDLGAGMGGGEERRRDGRQAGMPKPPLWLPYRSWARAGEGRRLDPPHMRCPGGLSPPSLAQVRGRTPPLAGPRARREDPPPSSGKGGRETAPSALSLLETPERKKIGVFAERLQAAGTRGPDERRGRESRG